MNSTWKCPHCHQTSNRRWNMQTHVLRKHNGFGTPINLMDNSVQLSTERHVTMDNAYEDHQYQRNSKNRNNDWARRTIREGRTILCDTELVDFLHSAGNKTYNCFNVHYEQEGYSQGPYMMIISMPPKFTTRFPYHSLA